MNLSGKRLLLLLTLAFFTLCQGCGEKKKLVVFHASSLTALMKDMKAEFEAGEPGVEIVLEPSGSFAACRKITELKRRADVIAVADYVVIERLLIPEFTDWYADFAGSRMTVAYGEHSQYGTELTADNWYEILARPDVKFGRVDPNLEPAGYRTLFCWELADIVYREKLGGRSIAVMLKANCRPDNVCQTESQLVPRLQNYSLDYAFIYESSAKKYHLKFIRLPDRINMGSTMEAQFYSQVTTEVTGSGKNTVSLTGGPIRYAFTIPNDAPDRGTALKFGRMLLSRSDLVEKNFFDPAPGGSKNVPLEILK
ncbi:MAG: substrate-binding domain-containing protein [Candidatus Wallbacteria bacterium]|nr:substrate-binding domain-containing protein [Candidatus Wallbacteria bacterium]